MANAIQLPAPQIDLDFPLMRAIEIRRTRRKWQSCDLSDQEISNLLWVAAGVTHGQTKRCKSRRTAPSACNSQEVKVYVALAKGVYLFDENEHRLILVLSQDIRKDIGTQKMMHSAPLGLIYVSDFSKLKSIFFRNDNQKWFTSAADTGFMSQNVYLYCAAAGLSTAVLSLVNRDKLHKIMALKECEKIVYTQVVGKSAGC
jgi:SagB-type dehydrogenase family enzyme